MWIIDRKRKRTITKNRDIEQKKTDNKKWRQNFDRRFFIYLLDPIYKVARGPQNDESDPVFTDHDIQRNEKWTQATHNPICALGNLFPTLVAVARLWKKRKGDALSHQTRPHMNYFSHISFFQLLSHNFCYLFCRSLFGTPYASSFRSFPKLHCRR